MTIRSLLLVLLLAVGLTVVFWTPLWQGGGLIGGDLYPYFFPQKAVYADQLAAEELPLWNRLVGFGYPLLAESQTGVLYPPNPLLYSSLSVNMAYNVSQLVHYGLAFLFTWLLMRRLDLTAWGATLAAVVFVYGWFPPRICLEWTIIGGLYLPLSLWCIESFLQTAQRRWLIGLAVAIGVHLLAGHFNLAFITQLTVFAYVILRVLMTRTSLAQTTQSGPALRNVVLPVFVAIACGFSLAAVQLLPTWELKQLSQRDEIGPHHDPGYGHIPPWYLSQIIAPWMWYTADSDPDQALSSIKTLTISSSTNKVEAHLYFGMLPLAFIVAWMLVALLGGEPIDRRYLIWLLLGLAAMIYTTGWLLPITRHLPGFSFFMGPGRYGIVTTLTAALLAGAGLDRVLYSRSAKPSLGKSLVVIVVLVLTVADLYWVSRRVTYAVMVSDPPVSHRHESEIGEILRQYERGGPELRPVRAWAPGANVFSLTGFASTPVYLGLGPAAYFDPALIMPTIPDDATPAEHREIIRRQRDWLRTAAVTHILRMDPLPRADWPEATLIWKGFDRLLNPAWGRFQQPLYLYELEAPEPFARIKPPSPGDPARVTTLNHSLTTVDTTTSDATMLTLAQLDFPGWRATIDGNRSTPHADSEFFAIDLPSGEHEVRVHYSPASVKWGAALSLVAWAGLILYSLNRMMRKRKLRRFENAASAPPTAKS